MSDAFTPSPALLAAIIIEESDLPEADAVLLRLRVESRADAEPVEVSAKVSGSAWSTYPREEIVEAINYRLNAESEEYRLSLVRALAEISGWVEVVSGPAGPYVKFQFELPAKR